jgi:hypothetical protein
MGEDVRGWGRGMGEKSSSGKKKPTLSITLKMRGKGRKRTNGKVQER